jgi:hypothetical protein
MLSLSTTVAAYGGIGFLGGAVINRPVYGIGYGISSALMAIALGVLFGPTGYYACLGLQTIHFVAKVGNHSQALAQIPQNQCFLFGVDIFCIDK